MRISNEAEPRPAPERNEFVAAPAPYVAPELTDLGALADLTSGSAGSKADGKSSQP